MHFVGGIGGDSQTNAPPLEAVPASSAISLECSHTAWRWEVSLGILLVGSVFRAVSYRITLGVTVDLFKNEEDSGVFQVTANEGRGTPPARHRSVLPALAGEPAVGVPAAGVPWPLCGSGPLRRLRRAPLPSPASAEPALPA